MPAPARPIERGIPGPGLLAQVIVAKYGDHCPLYRQQAIYRRAGVELERATLADWVGGASRLLQPLVAALGRYVLGAEKIHGDDTPVPVLDPGRGKTKRGRLWTYVRDDRPAASRDPPAVWYRYSPDRKGEHPRSHLKDFRGILQADAYSGFAVLYESEQIIEASCWAHARRKFFEATAAVQDVEAPAVTIVGAESLASGRWLRGEQSVRFDASDASGIRYEALEIAGQARAPHERDCYWAQLLRAPPCPNGPGELSVATATLPDGHHTAQVAVTDAAGNVGRAPIDVFLDNTPPAWVSIGVEGGDAWRNENGFAVSWQNPLEAHAPIDGALYQIRKLGDAAWSAPTVVDGDGISRIGPINVPVGQTEVRVWRRAWRASAAAASPSARPSWQPDRAKRIECGGAAVRPGGTPARLRGLTAGRSDQGDGRGRREGVGRGRRTDRAER